MSQQLDDLARRYGIALGYHEIDGTHHPVPDETKRALLSAFGVDASDETATGRSLGAAPPAVDIAMRAPQDKRCFFPPALGNQRVWGIALQVYQLRSARNWGIGDFADVAAIAATAAKAGADFIGTNPLHALFPAEPGRASPFFPSNRRFLNPLYIAVDRLPGFDPAMADASAIDAARAGDLVDYAAVTRLKYAALENVWRAWKAKTSLPKGWTHEAFAAWRADQGEALEAHALFDALSLSTADRLESGETGWQSWPDDYRAPDRPAARRFAADHAEDVDFHAWLQFAADRQLADAAEACRTAGMRIGLYLDLAVGEAPDGSATWTDPTLAVAGAQIGAPPDYFTKAGQNWALAGLSPTSLKQRDFRPYGELMRAVMRHAGAIRIDHAMGVWQLFFIPPGRPAAEGTYVRFPIADMLAAIADQSRAFRTIVVGEDLGNVPEGFRDVMDAAGLLSYRILYFERHEHGFRAPQHYPVDALACLSTHDLPTAEGWWRGADVALRHRFGLIDRQSADEQAGARDEERRQLCRDLADAGLVDASTAEAALAQRDDGPQPLDPAFVAAMHRHLARTASRLAAVRIEDLAGEREPVNLPGTVDEYPNWQRKLSIPIEQLPQTALYRALTEAMRIERPKSP